MILFSQLSIGQKWSEKQAEEYCNNIDKLKVENKLIKVLYPNMSACGGGLFGYYLDNELVLINSTYSAELGFSSKTIYYDNDSIVKIIYREHFAEWAIYEEKYPSDQYDWDPSKMTYSDTLYTITFCTSLNYSKSSNQTLVDKKVDYKLINSLTSCSKEMTNELKEVISQIDSLKFVTEMPYICRYELCGDNLFWNVVRMRQGVIELLIDRLDDTTSTKANIMLFGGEYRVADIAYVALREIIQDIPTFKLLGVEFDKNGCGYCSYYNYLNKDYKNRQEFKTAVQNWYFQNINNLVWVTNNNFTSCDCQARHPNEGHYEIKKLP